MPLIQNQIQKGFRRTPKKVRRNLSLISQTILEKTKVEDPNLYNTSMFLLSIRAPYTIRLLKNVQSRQHTYSTLHKSLKESKGSYAFYLRKAKEAGLIKFDRLNGMYSLTFKGTKALEILEFAEKIANFSISNPRALTELNIRLDQHRTWLEPVIREEIRKAVGHLTILKDGRL